MTFAEYYNEKNRFHTNNFLTEQEIEEMPQDAYNDLMYHLNKDDGTIGMLVYHSHVRNPETGEIEFKGMKIGYYLRSWEWQRHQPITRWFWKHRRVFGG